jgi:hypothetical protein
MAMSSGMPGANGPAGPNYDDKPAIRNTLRTRAGSTTVQSALLLAWAMEGGVGQAKGRLKDPATRTKIKAVISDLILTERGGGDPKNVAIVTGDWDPSLAGKNLAQLTQTRGLDPTPENAAETVLWLAENGGLPRRVSCPRRGRFAAHTCPPGNHDRIRR